MRLSWLLKKVHAYFQVIKVLLSQKKFRRFLYLFTILISLGFIALFTYRNLNQLKSYPWKIDPWYLLIAILSFGPAMLATIIAWHYLLKALGIHLKLSKNISIYSLSALPKHVPGMVLYLTNRSLLYEELGISPYIILTASALEILFFSLTGFSTSIILFLGSTTVNTINRLGRWLGWGSALVLLLIFLFNRILYWTLGKLLRQNSLKLRRVSHKWLFFSLVWMYSAWGGGGIALYFFARGLIPLETHQALTMISVWGVSGATSMTLGMLTQGFGIRELAMGGMLSLFLPPVFAAVIAIGFRILFTIAELIWVFIFLGIIKLLPNPSNINSQ